MSLTTFEPIYWLNKYSGAKSIPLKARFRSQGGSSDYSQGNNLWKPLIGVGIGGAACYAGYQWGDKLVSEASLMEDEGAAVKQLKTVCSEVIVASGKMKPYVTGQRIGKGRALAVCKPHTIQEAIDTLQMCVDLDIAIIPQGANTGLTGGSVPRDNIDRLVVVINMRHLKRITPVCPEDPKVVCLAGSGIMDVSNTASSMGRESHSVLGSLFLNPSVAAGIAFGSGGTQVRKGPAYSERVLYAKVNKDGKVEIVNNTGIEAESLAELFRKLETGDIADNEVSNDANHKSWKTDYPVHVCKLDNDVSRCNSDSKSPCAASRSEGKVMILASVHQTFKKADKKDVYWLSSDNFDVISKLRTEVALGDRSGKTLPASFEYMNKDCIDITLSHGTSACTTILLGGINNLGRLFRTQAFADRFLPVGFSDRIVQSLGYLIPTRFVLPKKVIPNLNMEHHVLADLSDFGNGELDALNKRLAKIQEELPKGSFKAVKLDANDVIKSNIFRFTNAAAFKIYCLLKKKPGVSLDYALRKNSNSGFPDVPARVHKRMIYGHFACNVIHDDIVFENGEDPHAVKYQLKHAIERDGGVLPAEHGHGTEYQGTAEFQSKLRKIDPLNIMNPGIAGTSSLRGYK